MKFVKALALCACGAATLALWGCQNSPSTPSAPESSLLSLSEEISANHSGGVLVDSSCDGSNSCAEKDKEDNTIAPGSVSIVWIVDGSGTLPSYTSCHWYVYDNGNTLVGNGSFDGETYCGSSKVEGYYFTAPNTTPGQSGSVKLEMWCNGILVGADSYRSTYDYGTCFK
jgi:hypothetical protein